MERVGRNDLLSLETVIVPTAAALATLLMDPWARSSDKIRSLVLISMVFILETEITIMQQLLKQEGTFFYIHGLLIPYKYKKLNNLVLEYSREIEWYWIQ